LELFHTDPLLKNTVFDKKYAFAERTLEPALELDAISRLAVKRLAQHEIEIK